jgi:hypothetical protein
MRRHAPPELVLVDPPAAGANFTQAVNDGYWWRLLSITCRLNTSATVADRTVRVEFRGADAVPFLLNGNPVTYPASTSNEDFAFNVWQTEGAWEVGGANLGCLAPILLQPGQDFRLTVVNIQAADTLTRIRYVVERFVAPSSGEYYVG